MYRQAKLIKSVARSVARAAGASRPLTAKSSFIRGVAPLNYLTASPAPLRSHVGQSFKYFSTLKDDYEGAAAERRAQLIVPKPLDAEQTGRLVELLKNPPKGEEDFLVNLLVNCVPPGVDEAAYVKAAFLAAGWKNI
jgi:hypothetical protein